MGVSGSGTTLPEVCRSCPSALRQLQVVERCLKRPSVVQSPAGLAGGHRASSAPLLIISMSDARWRGILEGQIHRLTHGSLSLCGLMSYFK